MYSFSLMIVIWIMKYIWSIFILWLRYFNLCIICLVSLCSGTPSTPKSPAPGKLHLTSVKSVRLGGPNPSSKMSLSSTPLSSSNSALTAKFTLTPAPPPSPMARGGSPNPQGSPTMSKFHYSPHMSQQPKPMSPLVKLSAPQQAQPGSPALHTISVPSPALQHGQTIFVYPASPGVNQFQHAQAAQGRPPTTIMQGMAPPGAAGGGVTHIALHGQPHINLQGNGSGNQTPKWK